MIGQFNAIVLDVVVIVILLAIIAVGVFKGVKHTLINVVLLLGSMILAIMPFTDVIKAYVAQLLANIINIGNNVAFSIEHKIAMSSLYMLMATIIFMLLIYVIARLIKLLIVRAYRKKNGIGRVEKSALSRVFGGFASLLVHGVLVVLLLTIVDNPLVGVDKTINSSYVTKYVARVDDMIIDAAGLESERIEANIVLLSIKGNALEKISEKDIDNFIAMAKDLGTSVIAPEKVEDMPETVNKMEHILLLQEALFVDENGMAKPGYEAFIKLTGEAMDKAVLKMTALNSGASPVAGVENAFIVATKLEKIYGATLANKFAELFVI